MRYPAVIFDIGGVVVGSPLAALAEYERRNAIPAGTINRIIVTGGADGAWHRLERGELTLAEFYPVFDAECAGAGCTISGRAMMAAMSAATVPRPRMLAAIGRIRASGRKAAAVTNNWKAGEPDLRPLAPVFDLVVESAIEGIRKPDPAIYERACERLGIAAADAVFLDDIGANLKTARALGMTTIKVTDPETALAELEGLLEIPLRDLA
jgi:putative hydrolase of the HAD superfamily